VVDLEPVLSEELINAGTYHHTGDLRRRDGRVDVFKNCSRADVERLHVLISRHAKATGSKRAATSLQLGGLAAQIPQGDAGRVPARLSRNGGQRGRRARKSRSGRSHHTPSCAREAKHPDFLLGTTGLLRRFAPPHDGEEETERI